MEAYQDQAREHRRSRLRWLVPLIVVPVVALILTAAILFDEQIPQALNSILPYAKIASSVSLAYHMLKLVLR